LATAWILKFVPIPVQVLAFAVLATSLLGFLAATGQQRFFWLPAILGSCGIIAYLIALFQMTLGWMEVLSLGWVLSFQWVLRRYRGLSRASEKTHNLLLLVTSGLLFLTVTFPSHNLPFRNPDVAPTLNWTLLGVSLMVAGLLAGERIYRFSGLAVLGLSLLSLMPAFLGMSTELKILSTFVTGAVFVGLGFVYTQYRERIRKML